MSKSTNTKRIRALYIKDKKTVAGYRPAQPRSEVSVDVGDNRVVHLLLSPGQLVNKEKLLKKVKEGKIPTYPKKV